MNLTQFEIERLAIKLSEYIVNEVLDFDIEEEPNEYHEEMEELVTEIKRILQVEVDMNCFRLRRLSLRRNLRGVESATHTTKEQDEEIP